MLSDEIFLSLIITIFSIVIIFLVDFLVRDTNTKAVILFLFFSESIVLTFFFEKFPFLFSFIITFFSSYFLISMRLQGSNIFEKDSNFFRNIIQNFSKYFRAFGFLLICSVLTYEFFGDQTFSSNDFLVLCLAILFILYEKFPVEIRKERDFLLTFTSFISLFFVLPLVIFKIISGTVGECNPSIPGGSCDILSFYSEEEIVYSLLSKPLVATLSLLGYNVFATGQLIFFEDLSAGKLQNVAIARSCAGIASIQVFISALLSYILVEYQKLDHKAALLLFFGIFIAYIANLFRMTLIIMIGHYWGIDALLLVHEYAGWIIFTSWVFLFWIISGRVLGLTNKVNV